MLTKKFFYFFIFIFILSLTTTVCSATDNMTGEKSVSNQHFSVEQQGVLEKDINENNKVLETGNSNPKILNSSTFSDYVTDGQFNDNISSGDIIDVQGVFEGSKYSLTITKPVNIVSSTGDAYMNFHTNGGGDSSHIFKITAAGAGTNITGITFYNTRVHIENTSNVNINNISCIDIDAAIGQNLGSFTVREGSENVTVTNSYFMTRGNGGHSNVVFAAAYNCLFENNTIEGYGDKGLIGNLLYLTTYNVNQANPKTNINITIRNNIIRSYNADSYATCYGLVLEGSGHIIEGNIIDNAFPVMAQYADADYDFETNINGIIFNNNTILRSSPQLVFPGIVSNNTFYGGAVLKQVYAYNNKFNTVTIGNSVIFENNSAKLININGANNTLNNNNVYSDNYALDILGNNNSISNNHLYSDGDYAVKISGAENILFTNSIASFSERGDNAILNSTEYTSIDNSNETTRVYYIDDKNVEKYFVYQNARVDLFNSSIVDGDIFVFNTSIKKSRQIKFNTDSNIIIENSTIDFQTINTGPIFTIKNSFGTSVIASQKNTIYLINSTVGMLSASKVENINSKVLSQIYPSDNTYIMGNAASFVSKPVINYVDGKLTSAVNSSSTIILFDYDTNGQTSSRYYVQDIYIDKPINIVTTQLGGHIDVNIHFIEGSEGSSVSGVEFDGDVEILTNVNFVDCTFNKEIVLSNLSVMNFEGNTFNSKVTLSNMTDIIFYNNTFLTEDLPLNVINSRKIVLENNTIETNASNTIIFDEDSYNNIVKNNYLVASELFGDDTVIGSTDIIDNIPAYTTKINVDYGNFSFVNELLPITITVNNEYNNSLVTKGQVKVYYDSVFQGEKELNEGTTEFYLNLSKIGTYPLNIWYFGGARYNDAFTVLSINVLKSNVTVNSDKFTAKMNEKAVINATFLNQKGNPVQDTNVTFTVGCSTYTAQTDNGVATINELVTSEWLDAGKITVTFPDTDAYNSNSTTITLNTSKADIHITPSVTVEGSTANINLALTDELNSNVTDGKITITTLDGTQLASGRVSNGLYTATVTIPDDYASEYLVANFTGSYYYNDLVRNIKLSGMLNSTITIETNSPVYGEELIITGKLVDSRNNAIKDTDITVNINGVKEVISTDSNGNYTYSILPELGVNTITVSFDGNSDVYATSETMDITIRDTDHDMNEVLNQLDELTAENARLQEQLDNLTQLSNDLKEQLANQTGELSEQNAALQQQIDTLTTIIAALTAPENTTLIFNDVVDARYKSDVVISGMLTSQKGLALSGQTVTLTIGDKTVDVITKNGEFEYTTVFKSVGEQTVTASYAGSDNYVASDASVMFDVAKQDVIVTVDPIADAAYGDNVTITGKFTDATGKSISNSNVRVFVNGKKFLAKTDKTGIYTLSVKVNALGENNVTVAYAGNDNYNSYEDTTTFNAYKQDVVVTGTVINIPKVGENVTITGTFTDKNGKAIINSNVKITINGKKYYARTDSTGTYTFTTTVTSAGMNNVTVGYSGNDKYNSYEDITTFNVEAQDVIVTVNPIEEVAVGDNITITGTFTDKYGKVIINSNVKILFNGKKYYARTDSTGTYTFTTTVTTEGINNITVGYAGSAKYNAYETSTTFIAKAE